MIEKLVIENLRSFAGETTLELAPITLVFGPNSAGKSTLIKALALLKQTLAPVGVFGRVERPELVLEGELADFGSFLNAVHRHQKSRELSVGLSFTNEGQSVYAGLAFKAGDDATAVQVAAHLGDGERRVAFKREGDHFELRGEPADDLIELVRGQAAASSTSDAGRLTTLADEMARAKSEKSVLKFESSGFFPSLPTPRSLDNAQTDKRYGAWFEETMYGRVGALDDLLRDLAYLGPLRAAPSRFQDLSRSRDHSTHVGPSGEHVTRLLLKRRELLREVNAWLSRKDRLDVGYKLAVHPVELEKELQIGDLVVTSLTRGGTLVTPQDVGFGISQLLPVVVQLLVNEGATICVEQPEIHIHPRLQTRLADLVLASAAPPRGNQVILESHSEHLILRLQTRIYEQMERKGRRWPTPDDVSIIYVGTDEKGRAEVTQIGLKENGDFAAPWPDGFFDERYEEVRARRRPPSSRRLTRRTP